VSAIDDVLIDLDAGRAARLEAQPRCPKVRLNGNVHNLPLEVPLDVFSPLKNLDVDFPLLVRTAVDAVKGQTGDAQAAATSLVIDLLVANPGLPKDMLDAFEQMGRRFLGDAAFEDLMAFRPSKEDLGLLVKGLFTNYGVSLGELSASSETSEDAGTTSKPTSSTTTTSTSEGSGAVRKRKAS
jgi:hypothetical protein